MARAHMEHALTDSGPDGPIDPEATSVEVSQQVVGRSPWELFWRRFRRDRWALGGAFVVIIMLRDRACSRPVLASATHGPNEVHLDALDSFGIPTGPQAAFPFGVDTAGRDLMVRVAYGARTSLFIAFFATGIATVIGVTLGMLAGFYRGKIDTVHLQDDRHRPVTPGAAAGARRSSRRVGSRRTAAWAGSSNPGCCSSAM